MLKISIVATDVCWPWDLPIGEHLAGNHVVSVALLAESIEILIPSINVSVISNPCASRIIIG